MGSKSDYLEKALLDEVLGGTNYAAVATTHIGLFTVTPSDTGGGTEVTGGSYARVAKTNNATNWPNASGSGAGGSSKSNGTAVTFPQASADWGTVVAFGIYDDPTAGNLLYWGAVSPSKTVQNGDTPSFAIGALTVTED